MNSHLCHTLAVCTDDNHCQGGRVCIADAGDHPCSGAQAVCDLTYKYSAQIMYVNLQCAYNQAFKDEDFCASIKDQGELTVPCCTYARDKAV